MTFRRARAWRVLLIGALAPSALSLAACDPCAGVYRCANDRLVRFSGRVIEFKSGRPGRGVQLTFRRTAGAELPGGEMRGATDADGVYTLSGAVSGEGDVIGTLAVQPPPPEPPYEITNLRLTASSRRGEGTSLLPIFVRPWFAYVGEVRLRGSNAPVTDAVVEFVPDGGGAPPAVGFVRGTDFGGRFYVEGPAPSAAPVVGTLVVSGGGLPRSYRLPGSRVAPLLFDTPPGPLDGFWQLGAAVEGVARFVDDATGRPFVQTTVEFVRTGGLPLVRDRLTIVTNDEGWQNLPFELAVDEPGEIVGDFTVRPAGQPARTLRGVRFRTIDSGDYRVHGVLRFAAP